MIELRSIKEYSVDELSPGKRGARAGAQDALFAALLLAELDAVRDLFLLLQTFCAAHGVLHLR